MTDTRAPDYNDKTDETRPTARPAAGAPTLEPNEARGAVRHHNVRIVLAVSLGAVVVLFAIVYAAFFSGAPPTIPA